MQTGHERTIISLLSLNTNLRNFLDMLQYCLLYYLFCMAKKV